MKFLTARWMSDEVKNFEQNLQNESYFICNRYISLLEEEPITNEWSWSKWHPFISLIETFLIWLGSDYIKSVQGRLESKPKLYFLIKSADRNNAVFENWGWFFNVIENTNPPKFWGIGTQHYFCPVTLIRCKWRMKKKMPRLFLFLGRSQNDLRISKWILFYLILR